MQRVKAHELRSKDEAALVSELTKQRKDLAALRVSKVSSQPQVKLSKIRVSLVSSQTSKVYICFNSNLLGIGC